MARFDRAIPPGGEGKIILELSTKGYEGTVSKSAVVYSNDPKQPKVRLSVSAQVKASISLDPRGVLLKGFTGDDITGVVTITAHKDQPLILEPVTLSLAGRVAYELKTVEKGRVYQAVLRNISTSERKYNGYLTLKTNYPEKPEISIRFVGHIKNRLQIQPKGIHFGRIESALPKNQSGRDSLSQRSVMVTLNGGNDLKIENVEINRKLFAVGVEEIQPGTTYRIDVTLRRDELPEGTVTEKMIVHTNVKKAPVFVIPVQVQIE